MLRIAISRQAIKLVIQQQALLTSISRYILVVCICLVHIGKYSFRPRPEKKNSSNHSVRISSNLYFSWILFSGISLIAPQTVIQDQRLRNEIIAMNPCACMLNRSISVRIVANTNHVNNIHFLFLLHPM